jgi:hypothetical protein
MVFCVLAESFIFYLHLINTNTPDVDANVAMLHRESHAA